MELALGIAIGAVIVLLVDKYKPRATAPKETEEERLRREEMENHLQKMMDYSVEKAYGGKQHG